MVDGGWPDEQGVLSSDGDPMEDTVKLERQIERCRRIASWMTDDEVRRSLEELADKYEAQLHRKGEGFMLQGKDSAP
jgi:hypothetical protein